MTTYLPFTFGAQDAVLSGPQSPISSLASSSSSSCEKYGSANDTGADDSLDPSVRPGIVEFHQAISLELDDSDDDEDEEYSGYSAPEKNTSESNTTNKCSTKSGEFGSLDAIKGRLLCILQVPSFMIPRGFLQFLSPSLNTIDNIIILRHYSAPEKYMALLKMESEEAARSLVRDFEGQLISSLTHTACSFSSVKRVSMKDGQGGGVGIEAFRKKDSIWELFFTGIDDNGEEREGSLRVPSSPSMQDPSIVSSKSTGNSPDTLDHAPSPPFSFSSRTSPYHFLDSETEDRAFGIVEEAMQRSGGMDGLFSYPLQTPSSSRQLFVSTGSDGVIPSPSTPPMSTSSHHHHHPTSTLIDSLGGEKGGGAPVTQTQISSFDAAMSEDTLFCPLCLDTISREKPSTFTTCCNHTFHIECAARLEGPQCPVCRFQHDSSPVNFSSCSICKGRGRAAGRRGQGQRSSDLWMCLVCGFTGCGESSESHIRLHYEQHLHAYAMEVETRRVWDFAGDGYVHRLILNQSDASDDTRGSAQGQGTSSTSSTTPSPLTSQHVPGSSSIQRGNMSATKLVEVPTPGYQHRTRSQQMPLTSEEEEFLVNRKLENVALHYNSLVAWQLEQTRRDYESRLKRLRAFVQHEISNVAPPGGGGGGGGGNGSGGGGAMGSNQNVTWAESIDQLLRAEENKARRQRDATNARLKQTMDELGVLRELNKSLVSNQTEWKARVSVAEEKLAKTEQTYANWINKLEKKVFTLMEKLDMNGNAEPTASTSVAASSSGNIGNIGGVGDEDDGDNDVLSTEKEGGNGIKGESS